MTDVSDQEDLANVSAFLSGDDAGFEALFTKYRERVYGIAYRYVRNKEDALEVVQEVFLRVHQSLAKFKTNSRFFTWLYRITANRSIDFTRSRKNAPVLGVETGDMDHSSRPRPRHTPNPVQLAQEHELEEKLEIAVAQLSEKHKNVFVLHAFEDLSYKQIAEVLECNIGTVMSRLFYARQRLKEILTELGIDLMESGKAS